LLIERLCAPLMRATFYVYATLYAPRPTPCQLSALLLFRHFAMFTRAVAFAYAAICFHYAPLTFADAHTFSPFRAESPPPFRHSPQSLEHTAAPLISLFAIFFPCQRAMLTPYFHSVLR
jgi:hypothetical protein